MNLGCPYLSRTHGFPQLGCEDILQQARHPTLVPPGPIVSYCFSFREPNERQAGEGGALCARDVRSGCHLVCNATHVTHVMAPSVADGRNRRASMQKAVPPHPRCSCWLGACSPRRPPRPAPRASTATNTQDRTHRSRPRPRHPHPHLHRIRRAAPMSLCRER